MLRNDDETEISRLGEDKQLRTTDGYQQLYPIYIYYRNRMSFFFFFLICKLVFLNHSTIFYAIVYFFSTIFFISMEISHASRGNNDVQLGWHPAKPPSHVVNLKILLK